MSLAEALKPLSRSRGSRDGDLPSVLTPLISTRNAAAAPFPIQPRHSRDGESKAVNWLPYLHLLLLLPLERGGDEILTLDRDLMLRTRMNFLAQKLCSGISVNRRTVKSGPEA